MLTGSVEVGQRYRQLLGQVSAEEPGPLARHADAGPQQAHLAQGLGSQLPDDRSVQQGSARTALCCPLCRQGLGILCEKQGNLTHIQIIFASMCYLI